MSNKIVKWDKEEDDIMREMVSIHGIKHWGLIASALPTRTGKQCRERWHNQLDPSIKKSPWTRDEERILMDAHRKHGNKWAEISKLLEGRTDNAVKNHFNSARRRLIRANLVTPNGAVVEDVFELRDQVEGRRLTMWGESSAEKGRRSKKRRVSSGGVTQRRPPAVGNASVRGVGDIASGGVLAAATTAAAYRQAQDIAVRPAVWPSFATPSPPDSQAGSCISTPQYGPSPPFPLMMPPLHPGSSFSGYGDRRGGKGDDHTDVLEALIGLKKANVKEYLIPLGDRSNR